MVLPWVSLLMLLLELVVVPSMRNVCNFGMKKKKLFASH